MDAHSKLYSQGQIKYALDMVTNLNFISLLQPGDKFYVSNRSISTPSYYDRLIRSLSGEDRTLIYSYIEKYVNNAISFIDSVDSKDEMLFSYKQDVIESLEKSITGINNLLQTYKQDRIYCVDLNNINTTIYKALSRHSASRPIEIKETIPSILSSSPSQKFDNFSPMSLPIDISQNKNNRKYSINSVVSDEEDVIINGE